VSDLGDNVIVVEGVSKSFRIPHVEHASLRGRILHPFAKTTYEEFQALDDVSFEVRRGEFFGIVGRNGSGKSTLLKTIAGIYRPDAGRVRVNGTLAPFIELGVGFNPELSGRENVYINGALLGLTTQRIRDRYDSIVEFAELDRFMDLKLRNFSSGMQVRLAFAIALEAGADVLLTDEVLAVGDENFQRKCFDVFRRRKESGSTVLFVTHDMAAVLDFCDRTMLLEHGRMTAIGDTRAVVRRYHELNLEPAHGEEAPADTEPVEAVTITGVRIVGVDGDEQVVPQGGTMSIEVEARANDGVEDPIVSVLVTDHLGKQVVHANTYWTPTATGRHEAGDSFATRFSFDHRLGVGRYVVHAEVALAGPGPVQHVLRDALRFSVTAETDTGAVYDPIVTVEVAAPTSPASS
jgi:ABC-type polysaccharide/polyol phosphate transport system ATPase subunit